MPVSEPYPAEAPDAAATGRRDERRTLLALRAGVFVAVGAVALYADHRSSRPNPTLVLGVLAAVAVVLGSYTVALALRARGRSHRAYRPSAVALARNVVRKPRLPWLSAATACYFGFFAVDDPNSKLRWLLLACALLAGWEAVGQGLALRRARALLASHDADPAV